MENLPTIEVVFVAKSEDLLLLKKVIIAAYNCSVNKITKICLIVPFSEVTFCQDALKHLEFFDIINIVSEELIVSTSVIELIRKERPDRFGWILQQVLVSEFILNSDSSGVLIVDSDTVLLRPKVWLDKFGRQLLMPTQEMHMPYYEFLRESSSIYPFPQSSYVSHHMLVQPVILREILEVWAGQLELALKKAFEFSNPEENSPFDLKYEIYAQYLLVKYPELVELNKWANLSLPRKKLEEFLDGHEKALSKSYNSVSFHHWNLDSI